MSISQSTQGLRAKSIFTIMLLTVHETTKERWKVAERFIHEIFLSSEPCIATNLGDFKIPVFC